MLGRSVHLFTIPLIAVLALAACDGETPTPGNASTPGEATSADPVEPADAPEPTAIPPTDAPTDSPPPTPTGAAADAVIPTPTPREAGTGSTGAANADVTHVRAVEGADGTWTFHVTVEHPDTGWENYADGWDVVTPDGEVINPDTSTEFTRLLLHPHENEQPFTRSQSGIAIPDGVTEVTVRAHDLVDGWGGREVTVDLTQVSGPDYEVERAE
jgi:hypothetical protein